MAGNHEALLVPNVFLLCFPKPENSDSADRQAKCSDTLPYKLFCVVNETLTESTFEILVTTDFESSNVKLKMLCGRS